MTRNVQCALSIFLPRKHLHPFMLIFIVIIVGVYGTKRAFASGTVTTCSEAALLAAISGGGLVTFDLAAPCTIILTTPINLGVGTDLTIDGSSQTVVISGNDVVGLFRVNGAALTLRNLELTRGRQTGGRGAALFVSDGTVTLIQTVVSHNRAGGGITAYVGGAAYLQSGSTMTVLHSTFTDNEISGASGASGGAIYKDATSILTIVNSTFTSNRAVSNFVSSAGAIFSENGPTTITNSLFSQNEATGTNNAFGGALYIYLGTPEISNSSFVDNLVQNTGSGSAYGGAIANFIGSPGVVGSMFARNRAVAATQSAEGGAWWNQAGNPTIINSTFTENSVAGRFGFGGAVFVESGLPTLQNITVASNHASGVSNSRGGGIFNRTGGSWSLNNSIVANNTATAGEPNCYNTPNAITGSFNLIYPTRDQCPAAAFSVMADPVLGTLAANGGPTDTMSLGAGSAAISAAFANCPAADQRYAPRLGSPALCDIGAYQTGAVLPQPPVISKQFDPTSIDPGAVSMLSLVLTNPPGNPPLTHMSLTDNLPTGLSIAAGAISNSCGPTSFVDASAGQTSISIFEINLAPNATCAITVVVTGTQLGLYSNTISSVFAAETGTSTINAIAQLSIGRALSPTPTLTPTSTPTTTPVATATPMSNATEMPPTSAIENVPLSLPQTGYHMPEPSDQRWETIRLAILVLASCFVLVVIVRRKRR